MSWFNLIKLFDPVRGAIKLWSMKKYPFDRRKRKSLKMSNSLVIARDFAKSCSNLAVTRPSSPTMARSDSSGINKQESHQASHCYWYWRAFRKISTNTSLILWNMLWTSTTRKFGAGFACYQRTCRVDWKVKSPWTALVGLAPIPSVITYQVSFKQYTAPNLISTTELQEPTECSTVEDNCINAIVAKGFLWKPWYNVELAENANKSQPNT